MQDRITVDYLEKESGFYSARTLTLFTLSSEGVINIDKITSNTV